MLPSAAPSRTAAWFSGSVDSATATPGIPANPSPGPAAPSAPGPVWLGSARTRHIPAPPVPPPRSAVKDTARPSVGSGTA